MVEGKVTLTCGHTNETPVNIWEPEIDREGNGCRSYSTYCPACAEDASLEMVEQIEKLEANLRGANLHEANLSSANLRWTDLSGADLSGADLSEANLSGANLSGANLGGANLGGAILSGADLSGADLSSANLRWTDLSGADLSRANLSGADLSGADLSGANLRETCVIDIGQRNDGFQFYLQLREGDEPLVLAGCRYFPISEARRHWEETRGGTQLGDESQALLDHGERMVSIRQRKEKSVTKGTYDERPS